MAYVLSRRLDVIDRPLTVTDPKPALSFAAERGLSRICLGLGAVSSKLSGSLKTDASVDAALRATLLQYAIGDGKAAKETAKLIGSDDLLRGRLAELVHDHFKLETNVFAT
jgi:hypothetical protein